MFFLVNNGKNEMWFSKPHNDLSESQRGLEWPAYISPSIFLSNTHGKTLVFVHPGGSHKQRYLNLKTFYLSNDCQSEKKKKSRVSYGNVFINYLLIFTRAKIIAMCLHWTLYIHMYIYICVYISSSLNVKNLSILVSKHFNFSKLYMSLNQSVLFWDIKELFSCHTHRLLSLFV
jgi:hypothetical protein